MQALESAKLQPGARVLVHAASGGVGHVAVQLAKNYWEAYVVGTARNVDFVKASTCSQNTQEALVSRPALLQRISGVESAHGIF